ncbi:MAG: hypothetical protein HQ553_06710 [Chloroflexi bacterium]|nr:hypothetical protein [Chloroflexota bacterium]
MTMIDAAALIRDCRARGATLVLRGNRLRVEAPQPLPDKIVAELKSAKLRIISELQRQAREETSNWILEEWRRISLPAWRRILLESIESNDVKREDYARWMLKEVLEDDEYKETDQ